MTLTTFLSSARPNIPVTPGLTHLQMQGVTDAIIIACFAGMALMFIGVELYKVQRVRHLKRRFEADYGVQLRYRDIIRTWGHESESVQFDSGQTLRWNAASEQLVLR